MSIADPTRWSLISEGGKNVVLRDDNGSGHALRLRKMSEPESIDGVEWRELVLEKLVPKEYLPRIRAVPVQGDGGLALRRLAERIEQQRSAERREEGSIDLEAKEVWETMDLTAGEGVCIEIKPKWLYLPDAKHLSPETAPWKRTFSRYRMHRVHKALKPKGSSNSNSPPSDVSLTSEWFEALYEPTRFLAHPREQVHRLYEEWRADPRTNNLKVFLKGRLLDSSKTADVEALTSHLGSLTLPDLVEASWPQISPLLVRLKQLQSRLDALDIEGLSKWWTAQTGSALGAVQHGSDPDHLELLEEPTVEEYADVAQLQARLMDAEVDAGKDGRGDEEVEDEARTMTLRQGVLTFLLSAMFKDCSVMVRFPPPRPVEAQASQQQQQKKDDEGSQEERKAHAYLVDLDPKPHTRLARYEALDLDIVRTFAQWAEDQGLKPESPPR